MTKLGKGVLDGRAARVGTDRMGFSKLMDRCMDGWIDRRTDGSSGSGRTARVGTDRIGFSKLMGRCMDGWIDGRTDGSSGSGPIGSI